MQLFSEDYLMHYGIKGMKWKKRKKPEEVKDPNEYLADSFKYFGAPNRAIDLKNGGRYAKDVRDWHRKAKRELTGERLEWHKSVDRLADVRRRKAIRASREYGYNKNQKRIAKQQRKARVKNSLKRLKNKIFVDTSGKQKVGKHLYVEHDTHLGR